MKTLITRLIVMHFCFVSYTATSQTKMIDSLEYEYENADHDSVKLKVLSELVLDLRLISPEKSEKYCAQGLELAIANADPNGQINFYNLFGILNKNKGSFDKAIQNYLHALKVAEENGLKNHKSVCLTNIGSVYAALGKNIEAIDYYNRSLSIELKEGNLPNISIRYYNLGMSYEALDSVDIAYEYYSKSLEIEEQISNPQGIYYALYGICGTNIKRKKYEEADENIEQAIRLAKEIGDLAGIAFLTNEQGNVYRAEKKYDSALVYYSKSLFISDSLGFKNEMKESYRDIHKCLAEKKDFEGAYNYLSKYLALHDSLNSLESSKQIAEMQTLYDTEKKEKEIELLKQEGRMKQILIISLIIGVVMVLILALVILNRYRIKRKANLILSEKNAEIEAQADQLMEVNKELEKLSIVARETDNGVIIMDKEGHFEWVNEGFTRMYDMTLEKLIEHHGTNIIGGSQNTEVGAIVGTCIEQKTTVSYNSQILSPSGKNIWSQTTLTPIVDGRGMVVKLIAIDSDITKLKDAEKEIRVKNIHIMDSISYASRIQNAILPSEKLIKNYLPDSFIIYMPKDVVSGDFYWFATKEEKLYIAAVDCTGHGVPGAFMSMIGSTMLNEIILNNNILEPSEVLLELNKKVVSALNQSSLMKPGSEGRSRDLVSFNDEKMEDGMDISLCCIDRVNKTMKLACASHLSYLIREDKGERIDGDIYSIGGFFSDLPDVAFTTHTFDIEDDMKLYMFSDGFQDQFGGADNKKFLLHNFLGLIQRNHMLDMEEQKQILVEEYNNWKANFPQLDDVLVIGIDLGKLVK